MTDSLARQGDDSRATQEISVGGVGATIGALNVWLDQARKLFAGPVDITCMALGTVLIAFGVWGRLFDPKAWAAPEFLALLSLAAILFLLASAERISIARAHQNSDEVLKLILAELENVTHAAPANGQVLNGHRRRWLGLRVGNPRSQRGI
jgi:hypothetical protein